LLKVKFWSVVELVTKSCEVVASVALRFESVVTPEVTLREPVKLAAELIVWPLMRPEVRVPILPFVAKRFVLDAVVAKKLVLVAFVVVALVAIRSVRPLSVVRLLRVVVAARAVSKRV